MIEPYVDEEVSWAVRTHQALRFFPDEAAGYEYPEMYIKLFGDDYKPEPYIVAEYERARNHKWYMTSRLICVNDIYSFDPNAKVNLDDFVDIIGRNFQPAGGRARLRQPPVGAHVAHHDVAEPVFVRAMSVPRSQARSLPRKRESRQGRWRIRTRRSPLPRSARAGGTGEIAHENRRRQSVRPHRARPAEFLYRPLGAAAEPDAADARARAICQRRHAAAHGACRLSCARRTRMRAS